MLGLLDRPFGLWNSGCSDNSMKIQAKRNFRTAMVGSGQVLLDSDKTVELGLTESDGALFQVVSERSRVLGQSKYSGLLGQTILPSLTSRGKFCVPSPDPKLVLTNLPVILLQMAKSNRNTRRTVNETAEGSASNVARNEAGRSACSTCGKMHSCVCSAATGACQSCRSMDHKVRDCPEEDLRPKSQNKGAGERVCYNCGETGHYKNQCPKNAQSAEKRLSDGPQPAAQRQAIMPEAGISEEGKVFGTVAHVHPGKHAGKNQKPVKAGSSSKPNATGRSACSTCGKMHSCVCSAATGACQSCRSMDHKVRDCPEEDLRPKSQNKGAGERVCYNCGETGHYKNQCPKNAQSAEKRLSDGPQPAAQRQAIMPVGTEIRIVDLRLN
ncbi:hypothetical protein DY000_02047123 [Brassica cretica]|uniref:CCHC-type domain-containing protein n=1 Tax=Brassica cretica TaxID=69181 RepID=A0ABQ7EU49_BRACR|nr:hypothetical protein DY000_02047123 [Brassica cretica]